LPGSDGLVSRDGLQPVTAEADRTANQSPRADAVLYEVRDSGVALITLNRPARMNGWGGALAAGFWSSVDSAEADPTVRVIVVTGSGRAFCAGADMGMMNTVGDSLKTANKDSVKKMVGERHPYFVTTLRKPVIAAINGACAGIGLTQALMCDVRFAAEGAKFTTSFARRGLVAEYGISWILPRLAGWGVALDLLLSGRVFYADEAHKLGLVNAVFPPDELLDRAVAYAEDIAAHSSPWSMAQIKGQAYGDGARDVADASARAEALMHESMLRPDFIEGIMSFFEKRAPAFPVLDGKDSNDGADNGA
jgi:enoyl-CoA hydratase/carnithine racemase